MFVHRMSNVIQSAAIATVLAASMTAAFAQGRAQRFDAPIPGRISPEGPQYGPGSYTENGVTVHAPRNCYVSREQRLQGGQLVWRPLVTCPYDDFR